MKNIKKVTIFILIQVLMVIDFSWCGASDVFVSHLTFEQSTLSSQVNIDTNQLKAISLLLYNSLRLKELINDKKNNYPGQKRPEKKSFLKRRVNSLIKTITWVGAFALLVCMGMGINLQNPGQFGTSLTFAQESPPNLITPNVSKKFEENGLIDALNIEKTFNVVIGMSTAELKMFLRVMELVSALDFAGKEELFSWLRENKSAGITIVYTRLTPPEGWNNISAVMKQDRKKVVKKLNDAMQRVFSGLFITTEDGYYIAVDFTKSLDETSGCFVHEGTHSVFAAKIKEKLNDAGIVDEEIVKFINEKLAFLVEADFYLQAKDSGQKLGIDALMLLYQLSKPSDKYMGLTQLEEMVIRERELDAEKIISQIEKIDEADRIIKEILGEFKNPEIQWCFESVRRVFVKEESNYVPVKISVYALESQSMICDLIKQAI